MKKTLLTTVQVVIFSIILFIIFLYRTDIPIENDLKTSNSDNEPGFVPAEEWFAKQRAFPFEEIPQDEYLRSIEQIKDLERNSGPDNSVLWTSAGPTNIEGRITTIAIHPANPQIVYTGTANGGLWKSTNFCQSWTSVFDDQNTSSIGSVAIDPANSEIIYCGTGESNSLRSYYPGTGIYKSTNGGLNWTFTGLDSSFTIGNISINPNNTQEIYAAAGGWTRRKNGQRGIYKSVNGGLNWSRKLFISDSVGAIDVVVDPVNSTKVIAAMWERQRREDYIKYGGRYSGIFISTNSGENWTQAGGGFPVNDVTMGRISLDISRSNSQIVYALTAFANGNTRGLFKSADGGSNWSLVNSSVASSSNYAWFNRICKTAPDDPGKVFCGGLNMELSGNGGVTFEAVSSSHVDQHAIDFSLSNPDYIVIGNDGGIDYSTDGGASWLYSNSLPITQFYAGEIDPGNQNTILGGTQDNGTNRTTGSAGGWISIYGGDGFYCLVDYNNSQNVYASSQYGGLVRSTNGGSTFLGATGGLDLTYTNWMTPFVIDKNNPQILYCGTYKIHKTTNAMQSWTVISPDLSNGHIQNLGTITTVDVSRSDPNVIYAGTDDANVWITTNGGANWSKINSGLPYRWVTRVAVHPDSANVCYVTLSGYKVDSTGSHIFRTTDYGTNWISIRGNLPDAPVNDVVIDAANTNTLYIGTDITVMTTTNLGVIWSVMGSGIPSNVPCQDLTFHASSRTLIAWTHGRSAFKMILPVTGIQNNSSQTPSSFKLEQNYPNPFNPVTVIRYSITSDVKRQMSNVKLSVFNNLGKEVGVLVNESKTPGSFAVEFEGNNFPSGVYFYSLYLDGNIMQTRKMMLLK